MADAAETSKLTQYVGNSDYLVEISPAVPEVELAGAGVLRPISATGDDSLERVITNHKFNVRIPDFYYGEQSNTVEAHREDSSNFYVEINDDMKSFGLMQCAFPGMSLSSPNEDILSRSVTLGQNGKAIDGTFDVGSYTAFDIDTSSTTQAGIVVNARDEIFIMVTEITGEVTLTLGTFDPASVANASIFPVGVASAGGTLSLVGSDLAGQDNAKGFVFVGQLTTIDTRQGG